MRETTKKYIGFAVVAICFLAVGYGWGFLSGLNWVFDKGVWFMEKHGIDLNATSNQIAQLVNHYIGQINSGQGGGTIYGQTILK